MNPGGFPGNGGVQNAGAKVGHPPKVGQPPSVGGGGQSGISVFLRHAGPRNVFIGGLQSFRTKVLQMGGSTVLHETLRVFIPQPGPTKVLTIGGLTFT